jgi:hypothetical protein
MHLLWFFIHLKKMNGPKFKKKLYFFFNRGARWGEWPAPRHGRFNTEKETLYPFYRRLGGPQDRYGRLRNISTPPRFDLWTVKRVAVPTRKYKSKCFYCRWKLPYYRTSYNWIIQGVSKMVEKLHVCVLSIKRKSKARINAWREMSLFWV